MRPRHVFVLAQGGIGVKSEKGISVQYVKKKTRLFICLASLKVVRKKSAILTSDYMYNQFAKNVHIVFQKHFPRPFRRHFGIIAVFFNIIKELFGRIPFVKECTSMPLLQSQVC